MAFANYGIKLLVATSSAVFDNLRTLFNRILLRNDVPPAIAVIALFTLLLTTQAAVETTVSCAYTVNEIARYTHG